MAKRTFSILIALLLLTTESPTKYAPAIVEVRDTISVRKTDTVWLADTVWVRNVVYATSQPTTDNFSMYRTIALHIKTNEGYRPDTYNCIAGYETIGWGHLWKEGEPKKVDKKTADLYFRDDFQRKFDRVPTYIQGTLLRHEQYAFTMLMFQCKMDKFSKSHLAKVIRKHFAEGKIVEKGNTRIRQSKYTDQIRKAWIAWSRYKDPKTGRFVQHPQFVKRRKFEVETFLFGENFVSSQTDEVEREYARKHKKYFQ